MLKYYLQDLFYFVFRFFADINILHFLAGLKKRKFKALCVITYRRQIPGGNVEVLERYQSVERNRIFEVINYFKVGNKVHNLGLPKKSPRAQELGRNSVSGKGPTKRLRVGIGPNQNCKVFPVMVSLVFYFFYLFGNQIGLVLNSVDMNKSC